MKTVKTFFFTFPALNNNYNDKKTEILKFIPDHYDFQVAKQENSLNLETPMEKIAVFVNGQLR